MTEHRYDTEKAKRLKFKFPGYESIQGNNSHAYQDIFAMAGNNGKRDGFFLEVGGFHPIQDSNTWIAEHLFGWKGISIEILNVVAAFKTHRPNTAMIQHDATTLDYRQLLKDHNAPERIDYLSLDIDPPSNTLKALKALPLDEYRFSVITYETDYYNMPYPQRDLIRNEERMIFEKNGYIKVCGNISHLNTDTPFEDWYLDGQYFDEEFINKFLREDDSNIVVEDYMFDSE